MQSSGLVQRSVIVTPRSTANVLLRRHANSTLSLPSHHRHSLLLPPLPALKQDDNIQSNPEETTKKYGLEAGLWKVFTSKNADGKTKGDQAKDLLKRYGSAYLLTSISFAIVSFGACYALVNAGVDVGALLSKVGLQVTDTNEKVGTFAIAYAAHKALSPVRFPPTVALTPVVAKWLGKDEQPVSTSSGSLSSLDSE